jgi:tripartite ATP-independent transporter DctM subunit
MGIVLLLILAFFVTAQVVGRYVFNIHIRGLFVYAQSALVIFPLLVSAYALKHGAHVQVDYITSKLNERNRESLKIVTLTTTLIFMILFCWYAILYAGSLFSTGATKPAESMPIPVPLGVLVSFMIFGVFLLALEAVRQIIQSARLLKSGIGASSSPGLLHKPVAPVAVYIFALIICLVLFLYAHPVVALLVLTVVLLFSGMPIFLALGLAGTAGLVFLTQSSLFQMPVTAFGAMNTFALTALPLFIVGGFIMESAHIVEKVFKFFQLFAGRFIASPLLVVVALGGFFCAVTGSTIGATAVVSAVAMPILISARFRKELSAGVIAGATVGTLIPPSTGFIIYGIITGESIAQLFFGGIGPAIVLFAFYFIYIIGRAIIRPQSLFEKGFEPAPVEFKKLSIRETFKSGVDAIWGLFVPVFVLGGIYMGVFTPTEAAAVMTVYAIIVTTFITRTLKPRKLIESLKRSGSVSTMILCLIITALILGSVVSQLRVAPNLVKFAESAGLGQIEVLLTVFVVLFILGMFINASSIMVITLPVFFPLTLAVGINPLWLSVFYIIVLEVGCLTPPVGVNLFAISATSHVPVGDVVRGAAPFAIMMLLTLVVTYLIPEIVTWLPGTMVK